MKVKLDLEVKQSQLDLLSDVIPTNEDLPMYLHSVENSGQMTRLARLHCQLQHFTTKFGQIAIKLKIDVSLDASVLEAVFHRLVIKGKTRFQTNPILVHSVDYDFGKEIRSIPSPVSDYSFPNSYLLQLLADLGAGPAFCYAFETPLAQDFALPVASPVSPYAIVEHLPVPIPLEMLDRGFSALYTMLPRDNIPFQLVLPVLESVFYISDSLRSKYQDFLSSPWKPLQVTPEQYMLVVQRILMAIEARARVDTWWCTVESLIRRKVPAPPRN